MMLATTPTQRSRRGALVGAPSGTPGRPISTNPGHLHDGPELQDGVVQQFNHRNRNREVNERRPPNDETDRQIGLDAYDMLTNDDEDIIV
jgi:hypothetical protein